MAELTNKEQAILDVFFGSDQSLTGAEVGTMHPDLNINTIQSVVRTLLKRGYIEVAKIVYSGTVLCRSYQSTEKAKEMVLKAFSDRFHALRRRMSLSEIFAALIDDDVSEQDMIDALKQAVKEKKEKAQK